MVNIEAYIGLDSNGIKTFYVDAEFDSHWIEGMSIESMAIGCEKEYTTGSYPIIEPDNYNYWEKIYTPEGENPEPVLKIHEEIPLTDFLFGAGPHLWVVYVKVNYDGVNPAELATLPCRDQKECYVAMVYDFENDLLLAMKLADQIKECEVPRELIDEILKIQALKLAIECGNIEKAMYFFTKFFSKEKPIRIQKGGCGCHGRKTT